MSALGGRADQLDSEWALLHLTQAGRLERAPEPFVLDVVHTGPK
jgi:hypothetical protein